MTEQPSPTPSNEQLLAALAGFIERERSSSTIVGIHVDEAEDIPLFFDRIRAALADSATGPLPEPLSYQDWGDEPKDAAGLLDVERNARIIAEYWRDEMMAGGSPLRACAHPLAMVLAALDGETDPVQMGIPPEEFQRRLASQSSGPADE